MNNARMAAEVLVMGLSEDLTEASRKIADLRQAGVQIIQLIRELDHPPYVSDAGTPALVTKLAERLHQNTAAIEALRREETQLAVKLARAERESKGLNSGLAKV